ncbi:hypothetical protein [Pilimelia columellifera]|uniref:Serine-threonine protein kinase n=1 Tax=Pilimelia columellifera subsp. columellifera TaxID=706583 RepID=A0ABN3N7E3_9ACTN
MVVGPFEQLSLPDGGAAPLYLLRYDASGGLSSPQTAQRLREDAAAGATDVFLFSHGWNNVFGQALTRYRSFIAGYLAQRVELGLPTPSPYRPLLVGLVWPSASFLRPGEEGPQIAAAGPDDPAALADAFHTERMLQFVTEDLDARGAAELSELVDGTQRLPEPQARRAVEIVRDAFAAGGDEAGAVAAPTVAGLLDSWARLDGVDKPVAEAETFGTAAVGAATAGAATAQLQPDAAGIGFFDPRTILRTATVWKMKGRAGAVGAHGVAPLVSDLLNGSSARLHLIGHSFGARLLLSALTAAQVSRPARSMLLLQAAINRWCFAGDVAGTGRAGGYRPTLARVEQPVLATLTSHDDALRKVFHLVMRGDHLGEPDIAAFGDEERYGALGGYGPAGAAGAVTLPILDPGQPYALPPDAEVVAIDGSRTLGGHGDVSNPSTWWLLHQLTRPV